jgi:hypothetical protein
MRLDAFATNALIDEYVAWREAEADVRVAYERWDPSDLRARELVFTSYLAALEREEHAALRYAEQVDRLGGLLGLRLEHRALAPDG